MITEIIKIKSKEWSRFQPFLCGGPCCNMAFPSGSVYGLILDGDLNNIASMVWYTPPFVHTLFRNMILPELRGLNNRDSCIFLNKNVKLLARISTLPKYRGHGFAFELIKSTLPKLDVNYVECLTAHEDVRKLLIRLDFEKKSKAKYKEIDYWLWKR